jgi:hypothetical protein
MPARIPILWTDERLFTFADVVRLTGYAPSRIHGYVARKQFRPQYRQPHGGARGVERRTYTPRDVLRLHLLGPAVLFGVHVSAGDRYGKNRQTLANLVQDLDSHVTRIGSGENAKGNERLVFPREYGPWCYLVLDLPTLAETQCRRLAEYRRLRDEGIEPAAAARESLRLATGASQHRGRYEHA